MRTYIVAAILILLFVSPSWAVPGDSTVVDHEYYVNGFTGNNITTYPWGRSEVYPWASPSYAIAQMAGVRGTPDTVYIYAYATGDSDPYNGVWASGDKDIHFVGADVGTDSPLWRPISTNFALEMGVYNDIHNFGVFSGFHIECQNTRNLANIYVDDFLFTNNIIESGVGASDGLTMYSHLNLDVEAVFRNNVWIQNNWRNGSLTAGNGTVTASWLINIYNCTVRGDSQWLGGASNDSTTFNVWDSIIDCDTIVYGYSGDGPLNVNLFYCDTFSVVNRVVTGAFTPTLTEDANCIGVDPDWVDDIGDTDDWKCFYKAEVVGTSSSVSGPMGVNWGYEAPPPPPPLPETETLSPFGYNAVEQYLLILDF